MVMGRRRLVQELYVFMNGIQVGKLLRESSGILSFIYDTDWLNLKNSRPISLSMPLTDIPYKGQVVESYFDNLLPDSELIRKRIQARFNIPSNNCFDLLANIGVDCVGALQLLTEPKASNIKKIQANPIEASEISKLLKNYQTAPLGMDRRFDFRISIAGVQEKTALLWYQDHWHLPKGATPTTHIIKLPIGKIIHSGIDLSESIENEWLCLKILEFYNLNTNQSKIELFDGIKTLVVERFDRRWAENGKWIMRLPQEDMCQALGYNSALKYESDGGPGIEDIMNILLGAESAIENRTKFMKSVFLFWVLGAIDGHAKNFSISIEAQGRYHLTPLYDVLSAYPIAEKHQLEWHNLKMAMALKSKNRHYLWNTIQLRHWIAMASKCQFSENIMKSIMDEVFDNMELVIDKVKQKLPSNFPSQLGETIFSGMKKIKNKSKY